ncbi:hypothetical protein ACH4Q6_29925, partial [Streptomyces lydicus]
AGGDRSVRIWDLTTGTPLGEPLTGHTRRVWAVASAEVGGRPVAVTGAGDRAVRVWDLITASCLTTLALPDAAQCAHLVSDGTLLLGMGHEVIALSLEPVLRRRR